MLVFISFFLFFFVVSVSEAYLLRSNKLLKSVLFFSLILVFATEIFSLFKILNLVFVISFWSMLSVACIIYLAKQKDKTQLFFTHSYNDIKSKFLQFSIVEKLISVILLIFIIALFLQGILYPPNNWDTLSYHLPRVVYWISNQSVEHFPTHILRHLYQPPFVEYIILHVNLIQGNDYFSNSIQLIFLVLSLWVIHKILRKYDVNRINRLAVLLLVLTIPSVALQASTAKNDIVCAFFVLCTIYFSTNVFEKTNRGSFIFLGISVGLGMLTKGTYYIFSAPILAFLFFALLVKQKIKGKIIAYGIMAVVIAIIINIERFHQNYNIDNDILNIDKNEAKEYSNTKMNATLFASNVLKNSGLHLGYPIDTIGNEFIQKVHHNYLKISPNNPETNYYNSPYDGKLTITTHEDGVPNTFHFFLIGISIIVAFAIGFTNPKKYSAILILTAIIIIQILFFCGYLKWQPWHTRLHIPIFITAMLLVGLLMNALKIYRYVILITIPMAVYGFYFFVRYNNLRPFSTSSLYTKQISLLDSRYKKYFANQQHLYENYNTVYQLIDSKNVKIIGFMMSDWEYPLMNNFYHDNKKFYAVNVNNVTSIIKQDVPTPDVIVSNISNEKQIFYNGKRYVNITSSNTYLWCYKK